MSYAMLSGIEIAEAIKRHRDYLGLRAKATPDLMGDTTISWFERRRLARLEKLPRLHIDNFDPTPSDMGGPLNPNSYNLTLAPELLVYAIPVCRNLDMLRTPEDWAPFCLDMRKDNPTNKVIIPPEGRMLKPGRLYVGRSVEHTESYNLCPTVHGRSSIGRLGMSVHITAGYIDVGFQGTITLEISVIHPLRVYPGVRICQMDYATISPRHRSYRSKKYMHQTEPVASRLFMDFEPKATEAIKE